jgi:hypothetical protein
MTSRQLAEWARENRFWLILLFMIFAGYTVGKDLAERENARDRIAAQETSE